MALLRAHQTLKLKKHLRKQELDNKTSSIISNEETLGGNGKLFVRIQGWLMTLQKNDKLDLPNINKQNNHLTTIKLLTNKEKDLAKAPDTFI